jgi:plasmid stability protein
MYTAQIRRKQLYLTDDIDARLRARAEVEGRSEAAIVRDALILYLGAVTAEDPIMTLAGIARALPAAEENA